MSNIYLHNTLSGKKELFKPLKGGGVSMYNCGPTVYDYQHIGNFRGFIFVDSLRRMFEFNGYKVEQIINITDIGHLSGDNEGNADEGEDRMTKALKREGKPLTLEAMRELADFYTEKFKEDLLKLNIETPKLFPYASDNIPEQKEIIQKLLDKDIAYPISDGIYFDTAKFPSYGELGGSYSPSEEYSRIGINIEKRNPRDFALWKYDKNLGYETPWGKGFPGWHIECSAMSRKYLGETIDIHTGGIEHIQIHHNNEIAQSESASGKKFVNYWLHNEHLQVDGGKMAKSQGNAYILKDLEEKGFSPLDFRFLVLSAHYKSPINFTFESLTGAKNSRHKLIKDLALLPEGREINQEYLKRFINFINDDLGMPQALSLVYEVLKSDISPPNKLATILKFDQVLGLDLLRCIVIYQEEKTKKENNEIPIVVQNLVTEREVARKNQKFERADMLRNEIAELGFIIEDSDSGPKISKK